MAGRIEALIPERDLGRVGEMTLLVRRIVGEVEAGRDAEAMIGQLNEAVGPPGYEPASFAELHGWTSAEGLAELVALGRPPAVSDISEDEIAECVRIVGSGKEPRVSFYLRVLERSFPHLPISDMIFHPEEEMSDGELAAQIFSKAGESRPILLGPPPTW